MSTNSFERNLPRKSELFLITPKHRRTCRNAGLREQKMKIDHLISTSVANEDYEGAMVFLDIIVDEELYALVKLFPHTSRELFCVEKREKDGHVRAGPHTLA